ncbi:TPA: hypothetical protein NDU46_001022 [Pseudomonas aeruginosa]|nr:hypothetical protein [Pseudomonas aeruginosa]
MMITLSPVFVLPGESTDMDLAVYGDAVHLNGEVYDFSPLPECGELPAEAIGSEWFAGPVVRRADRLELSLRFPLSDVASAAARFPEPLLIDADGPVELPR